MSLSNLAENIKKAPPLEKWSPPFCGVIDMTIKRDGTWLYQGSPIHRPALVTLFSTVLWLENDNYYLKTPVELVQIKVEDLPFLIVELRQEAGELMFRTLQNEWVSGETLEFENALPRVLVRRNLWGRINRAVYYELLDKMFLQNGFYGLNLRHGFKPLIAEADFAE